MLEVLKILKNFDREGWDGAFLKLAPPTQTPTDQRPHPEIPQAKALDT